MSLKDLIRSLIESTFTSKKAYISNQAMPSSSITNYQYEEDSDQSFTSPNDGYLTIGGSLVNGVSRCVMWGGIESTIASNEETAAYVPMRKGQTVYFSVTNPRFIKFVSTIGGGLNQIIQAIGGGLCLLSHLSKRFLNASLIEQAQRNKLAIKCLRQQELIGTRRLFLRLTDLRQCISLAWFNPFTSQTSKLPEALLRSLGIHSLAQFIRNTLLLLEKAKYFVSAFMRTKAGLQLSILPHGSARLDFCKGGAL